MTAPPPDPHHDRFLSPFAPPPKPDPTCGKLLELYSPGEYEGNCELVEGHRPTDVHWDGTSSWRTDVDGDTLYETVDDDTDSLGRFHPRAACPQCGRTASDRAGRVEADLAAGDTDAAVWECAGGHEFEVPT